MPREHFIAELIAAFAAQYHGPDHRGAEVDDVVLAGEDGDDFALTVSFHALPCGPRRVDTINGVLRRMQRCDAATASELAGLWQEELDELVLTRE